MNTVHVKTSKEYDILIENGLIKTCDQYIKNMLTSEQVVIVTDDVVADLYLENVKVSLTQNGISPIVYIFKNGEASKNAETYLDLLQFLAQNHINRKDSLIALGGGVVGDLTGFAAATFLRGIGFIQIPTTLLACVDSSVGGKTAIDLPAGKNLVGAFYQPSLVVCDPAVLSTLDEQNFKSGMAEVIKYGIICDKPFFDGLMQNAFTMTQIITKCVEIKRDIVQSDEFDVGKRQLLNFGHTLGHGIEASCNFELIHGLAVAIGMVKIAEISQKNNLCDTKTVKQIYDICDKYGLPKETDIPLNQIMDKMLNDKKVLAKNINLVIPREIGKCELYTIPIEKLNEFITKGF